MFIGREAELLRLEQEYARERGSFVPIYGRRRVGKSELILHFLRDRPGLYFLGKQAPEPLQIREFLGEASKVLDEPLLAEIEPVSWKHALALVADRWKGDRRLVVALDEFQWIAGASPDLPSVLQELWDRDWRESARLMLIICGSYVGFMERAVLGRKSPLFGRRTAQIQLRPFGHIEAAAFHPGWSLEEIAKAYFVCGGVPLYHKFFSPNRSFEQNLKEQLLEEYAPLHREPEFLLREELREVESYHAVLMAIALGNHTAKTIAGTTGLPERSLHYWIQQLSSLGYIAKKHPLTRARPVARHVRYVLEDALLRFWFRYVFPNLSHLQFRGPGHTYLARIRPGLDAYWGLCFKRLCREALPQIYLREGVECSFDIGEYWSKNVQIDLIGLRDDAWTDLGECKWGTVRSVPASRKELQEKVVKYPNPENATIGRRFFLRRRPSQGFNVAPGEHWHDLTSLYD